METFAEQTGKYVVYFVELQSRTKKQTYHKIGVSINNFETRLFYNHKYRDEDGRKRTHGQPLKSMMELFHHRVLAEKRFASKAEAERYEQEIIKRLNKESSTLEKYLKSKGYKYSTSPLFFKGVSEVYTRLSKGTVNDIVSELSE